MAEYIEVDGDLLDPAWGFRAIGHGVNCMGVMGAGIAKQIKELYPEDMFDNYRTFCLTQGADLLGANFIYGSTDGPLPVLFNMFTQILPGPNAVLQAIAIAGYDALNVCNAVGIDTLGLPMLGCGIGGLNWQDVSSILQTLVSDSGVGITVVRYVANV